jgi:hypothetical protein
MVDSALRALIHPTVLALFGGLLSSDAPVDFTGVTSGGKPPDIWRR